MDKKFIILILIAVFVLGGFCLGNFILIQNAVAQAEKAAESELSRSDMLQRVNSVLEYHLDIRSNIPGIGAESTAEGMAFTYNGTPLEKLDDDTLAGLFRTVNGQVSMKNFQRQERQMRNLKQIDNINKLDRQQRQLKQQR